MGGAVGVDVSPIRFRRREAISGQFPRPWQAISPEPLSERLRVFRLAKAEHHEVGIVATEVIRRRATDRLSAKSRTASFLMPRTLSAASATWCGRLRMMSA